MFPGKILKYGSQRRETFEVKPSLSSGLVHQYASVFIDKRLVTLIRDQRYAHH